MDIEFQQIVGVTVTSSGPIETPTGVDRVLLNGRQVGVIGQHSDAIFGPLAGISSALAKDIVAAIAKKRLSDGTAGPPSKTIPSIPPEPLAELHAAADAACGLDVDDDGDDVDDVEVYL